MQNKGIVITEITEPQICNPPKRMLVWDFDVSKAVEKNVVAILPRKYECTVVVEETESCAEGFYRHCAEIPEAPKPRRATNKEVSKWLAQGNGQCEFHTCDNSRGPIKTYWEYIGPDNNAVVSGVYVRKWGDTEWQEPTVDYMGIEEVKNEGA